MNSGSPLAGRGRQGRADHCMGNGFRQRQEGHGVIVRGALYIPLRSAGCVGDAAPWPKKNPVTAVYMLLLAPLGGAPATRAGSGERVLASGLRGQQHMHQGIKRDVHTRDEDGMCTHQGMGGQTEVTLHDRTALLGRAPQIVQTCQQLSDARRLESENA